MSIVHAILGNNVVIETIEIFVGQQLTGKEPRPTKAFEASARRARQKGEDLYVHGSQKRFWVYSSRPASRSTIVRLVSGL